MGRDHAVRTMLRAVVSGAVLLASAVGFAQQPQVIVGGGRSLAADPPTPALSVPPVLPPIEPPEAEPVARIDQPLSGAVIRPVLDERVLAEGRFRLGLGLEAAPVGGSTDAGLRWGGLDRVVLAAGLPGVVGEGQWRQPQPIVMTPVLRWDAGDGSTPEVLLLRMDRTTWDDFDTWEKIGWVTAQASALAGIYVLLDELF